MDTKLLFELLKPYSKPFEKKEEIKKSDLYALGMSGGNSSSEKRDIVSEKLGLPKGLTPNAFLDAVNVLVNLEQLKELINE